MTELDVIDAQFVAKPDAIDVRFIGGLDLIDLRVVAELHLIEIRCLIGLDVIDVRSMSALDLIDVRFASWLDATDLGFLSWLGAGLRFGDLPFGGIAESRFAFIDSHSAQPPPRLPATVRLRSPSQRARRRRHFAKCGSTAACTSPGLPKR